MQEVMDFEDLVNEELGHNLKKDDIDLGNALFGHEDESITPTSMSKSNANVSNFSLNKTDPSLVPATVTSKDPTVSLSMSKVSEGQERKQSSDKSGDSKGVANKEEREGLGVKDMQYIEVGFSKGPDSSVHHTERDSFNTPSENMPPECGKCENRQKDTEEQETHIVPDNEI